MLLLRERPHAKKAVRQKMRNYPSSGTTVYIRCRRQSHEMSNARRHKLSSFDEIERGKVHRDKVKSSLQESFFGCVV